MPVSDSHAGRDDGIVLPRPATRPTPPIAPPLGPLSAVPRVATASLSTSPPVAVAVADDNARFRSGIVRALGRCDDVTVVAEADDGTAALQTARRLRPDVLVVDDRMPGLTGPEVARAVSADPMLRGVRVVLLTARVDPAMTAEAARAGAVACLDKASSRREICTAIRAAAGRATGAPVPA